MIQANIFTKQRLTNFEKKKKQNKLTVTKEEKEWRRDKLGVWDQQIQIIIHKTEQQGATVQHKELDSIPYNNGKEHEKVYSDFFICIYKIHISESLCCAPETNNYKSTIL